VRLRSSVTLKRGGRRWCQAASISSRRACVLPALVIPPWRRRSPARGEAEERAERLGAKPAPVAELDGQRERRERGDAAETDEPADEIDVRLGSGELGDRLVERVSSGLRVEHPAVALVEDDRERCALEPLPAKPPVVRPRPGGRVVDRPMAQEQLREPVAGPHQIAAGVLAGAYQIARGLLFGRRHPYGRDLTQP
jgi:hypothetical protein